MTACLSCAELEAKICDLADKLASDPGCAGIKRSEAGISEDRTAQMQGMRTALDTYRSLYEDKKCASQRDDGQLYEYRQSPCITEVSCGLSRGAGTRRVSYGRRYRR